MQCSAVQCSEGLQDRLQLPRLPAAGLGQEEGGTGGGRCRGREVQEKGGREVKEEGGAGAGGYCRREE